MVGSSNGRLAAGAVVQIQILWVYPQRTRLALAGEIQKCYTAMSHRYAAAPVKSNLRYAHTILGQPENRYR